MVRSNRTVKVKIEQDEEAPIERRVLAVEIMKISAALSHLLDSGLNERAIVALVADATDVGRPDIRAVLTSLKTLHREFCH